MTVTSCITWAYRFTAVYARVVFGCELTPHNSTHEVKLKILYIANELSYFRAHRENVAISMANDGHEVIVASGEALNTDIKDWPASMKLMSLEMDKHALRLTGDLNLIRHLAKTIRQEKPDIVHAITIKPILMGSLAARLILSTKEQDKIKFIWTFAGLGKIFEPSFKTSINLRKKLVSVALKVCNKRLNAVTTFENKTDQKFMIEQGLTTDNSSHVLMGTGLSLSHYKRDAKTRQRPKSASLVFLMATRLINEKGVDVYLKAAQYFHENTDTTDKARFLLAGTRDPSNPDSIDMNIIDKAVSDGCIEFIGAVGQQDMPALFNRADVFCLPTRLREGFPRSLLEAAACGCALIASDQETNRRIVLDGKTGVLLPKADLLNLKNAILTAINNKELNLKMGRAANKYVQSLPVRNEDIVEKFKTIYSAK